MSFYDNELSVTGEKANLLAKCHDTEKLAFANSTAINRIAFNMCLNLA